MKKCYLSENISIYRKSRSMTQSDLAQQLGVSHQAVSLWERGETLPDVALLPQLAEVLQTSVESLFQTPSLQQQEKAAGERAEGTEQQKETSDEEEPSFSPDEEKQRFASLTDSIESMVRRMVGAALETSMNPPSRRYKDLSGLGKQAEKGFSQFPFPDDGAVRARPVRGQPAVQQPGGKGYPWKAQRHADAGGGLCSGAGVQSVFY